MISKKLILRIALVLFIFNIDEGKTLEWSNDLEEQFFGELQQKPLQRIVKSSLTPDKDVMTMVPEVKYVNVDDYQDQGPELIRKRRFLKKCKKGFKKLFKKDKCKKCKCKKKCPCEQPKKDCGYSYDTYEKSDCHCKKPKKCDCHKTKKCDCYKTKPKCDCKHSYKPNKITVKPIIHLVPIQPLNYGGCNQGCQKPKPKPKYVAPKKTAQITKVDVMTYSAPVKEQPIQHQEYGYGNHGGYKKPNSFQCEEVGYSGTSHGYEAVNLKSGGYDSYSGGHNSYSGGNEYGHKYTSNYDSNHESHYDKGYIAGDHGYSGSKITALIQPSNKKQPVRIFRSNTKISDDQIYKSNMERSDDQIYTPNMKVSDDQNYRSYAKRSDDQIYRSNTEKSYDQSEQSDDFEYF